MRAVNSPRSYHSPQREESARATRLAILRAARDLFIENGYVATTVDQIAERARVSRPTVFAVGNKADLLRLVRDVALAGDDEPVPVSNRRPHRDVVEEPNPVRTLELEARNVVAIAKRYAEIDEVVRQGAGVEPALRQLWETSEAQRRIGASEVIDSLRTKGRLRTDLSKRAACDLLWLLIAPDHYLRLTRMGWSARRYEKWLAATLCQQLLEPNSAD